MLEASRRALLERLSDDAVVLDVGGWASPLPRADWVIDLQPYETRGLYGTEAVAGEPERFSAATWVQADICARERWPFEDGQFDFAVCSHTLEDVRDPVWVCSELDRVARAGYIEAPARVEEQTAGVQGPWVGWGHHHWFCETDQEAQRIEFVFKHHIVHGRPEMQVPYEAWSALAPQERVVTLWWEGSFSYGERIFTVPAELERWLTELAERHRGRRRRGLRQRLTPTRPV